MTLFFTFKLDLKLLPCNRKLLQTRCCLLKRKFLLVVCILGFLTSQAGGIQLILLHCISLDMCRLVVQYGDHQPDNDMQMICNETCLNRTLNKPKSYINRILNEVLMQEIFVNLICANRTLVYSEHKS
jgi:hypothetical protein